MYRGLHRYQKAGLVNIDPENTLDGEQVYEAANMLPEVVVRPKRSYAQILADAEEAQKANSLNRRNRQQEVENFARDLLYSKSAEDKMQEYRDDPTNALAYAPFSGEAMDAQSVGYHLSKGNYGDAAMYGAGFVIPGVSGAAVKKFAEPLVKKTKGFGKKVLDKAGLTRQRLDLEGNPITAQDIDINRTVSRSELEDQITRDRDLVEQQIDIIEADEMMGNGYMSQDVQYQIDALREEAADQAYELRRLANEGGIRVQGSRGIASGVTDRGLLPEGIARKANPQNRGEMIEYIGRDRDGYYEVYRQPTVSVGTNRSADRIRQTNATLREFEGPFGKETTRIDNPFSGESMRYQDIPGDFRVSGTGIEKLDSNPKVRNLAQSLSTKKGIKKLASNAADYVRNFSPRREYRMAQETKVMGGDSDVHAILPTYPPEDPTGIKYAMREIRKTMNKVSSVPGSRFQDASMSTDSFPLVLRALTGSMADKFKVKNSGTFVPLNSFGWGGSGYQGPNRVVKGELQAGYNPNQLGDIVNDQGKVITHGAESTVEMINEKIRALNKKHGSKIPMARVKTTDYGTTDVEVPLIFADAKFESKGLKRAEDEIDAWIKRNPENIKRGVKGLGAGTSVLGSAAIYRYANRNEDE